MVEAPEVEMRTGQARSAVPKRKMHFVGKRIVFASYSCRSLGPKKWVVHPGRRGT